MRLAKPVVIAFELAAAGGAALILSGSALAADSSLGTVSQMNSQSGASVQQTGQQSTGDDSAPATNVRPEQDKSSEPTQDGHTDQAKATGPEQSSQPAAASGVTAVKVMIANPAPVAKKAPEAIVSHAALAQPQSVSQVPAAVAAQTTQDNTPTKPAEAVVPAMTFRTAVLPLQPTITSRERLVSDLASTVPTPPKPDKAPVPAKSSGALGKLTAELASVVVPQWFALPAVFAARVLVALEMGILALVLLPVFVFSYGLWLRRGGFATAARSDSPIAAAVLYLLHQPWVMSQRRRAKDITHFLVSEPAGVHVMGAA